MQIFYTPEIAVNLELPEEEAGHCIRVLRLTEGDEILLTDGKGFFFKAAISRAHPKHCEVNILEQWEQPALWNFNLHIAVAPTKNMDRMEWFAEKATEIGINAITCLNCRFSERKEIKPARLEKILVSAMKQSQKATLPELNGMPDALMLGVVVSGAMFGDNLSFISDTTIVATRTQGCNMNDKFKVNIRIALPIAILTGLLYVLIGSGVGSGYETGPIEWIKVLPYLVVLVTAICGVNVMMVLIAGIILSGIVGLLTGGFDIWGWNASMGLGITNMGELIIVTLLAGGMLEMIRYNGGIDWIILKLTSRIRSTKGAEGSIAALISFANLCTANNTIALIMAGPIAKDIADRFKIDPRRSASLLDIFSCFVQGIIPYGAQLLMAAGLGHVSPIEIMQYLYYPYLLGVGALLAITFNYPRKYAGDC